MADLENLLLEAAGRTGGSSKNRHSRPPSRRQASYSDDGSDDNSDNSDDYSSRKPTGYQVPLKKRLDPTEKSDSDNEGEYRSDATGSDESDVGSDLYKDDYDREHLAQMTELEREMILSERAQRRDDQRLTERVRSKQPKFKKTHTSKETPDPDTPSSRVRSSSRFAERPTRKDDALNNLRAKRLKQQENNPTVRKKPEVSTQSSDDENDSDDEEERSVEEEDNGESDKEEELTLEDIQDITIRRSKLAKWFMEPFFEDVIVGCFVRVGIGKRENKAYYRLCVVKNVDATEPNKQYKLENKSTYKYLSVTWGRSEARWQMAVISESPPVETEFNEWVKAMKKDGVRLPTKQEMMEKRDAIQKAVTFVYSSATVKQMLQEKKSASSRPLNIAAEKERLRRELDSKQNNKSEVERIKARLAELDEISKQTKMKDDRAVKLAEMNKKNRAENFKNASEMKPVNQGLKAGEAGYDPFSRRWTMSRNYYVKSSGGGEEEVAVEGGGSEAVEAAVVAGKLVDTNAPVDLSTEENGMYNFEVGISLVDLERLGGAGGGKRGFLERKMKIEAAIGCRVVENDGRRHSLTLSVSDYKRRRGLL